MTDAMEVGADLMSASEESNINQCCSGETLFDVVVGPGSLSFFADRTCRHPVPVEQRSLI
jgi:hypothetical protein